MTAAPIQVYSAQFQDEAPQIGSGLRFFLAKVGRKWAYLLSPHTLGACRMPIGTWNCLSKRRITDPDITARINAALQLNTDRLSREATRFEKSAMGGEGNVA